MVHVTGGFWSLPMWKVHLWKLTTFEPQNHLIEIRNIIFHPPPLLALKAVNFPGWIAGTFFHPAIGAKTMWAFTRPAFDWYGHGSPVDLTFDGWWSFQPRCGAKCWYGCWTKNRGFYIPNHPFVHRVFHEINHPFWGTFIFGNIHMFV